MFARPARCAFVLWLGLLAAGCQSPGPISGTPGFASAGGEESGTEAVAGAPRREGGLLLRTGAIQLGPGLGRNAWRWQGDGLAGF